MLDEPEISHTFPSSVSVSHPLPWSTRDFRQSTVSKRLTPNIERDPITLAQKNVPQVLKNPIISPKQQNSTLKSVIPQNYCAPFLQWPKSELLVPRGITSVTEKRLLARVEALNQRNQTGISAAQSLPKINESIALQLHQNHLNGKKVPWTRATASEPQLISLNRGHGQYRLAAKAPVHYNPQSRASRLTPGMAGPSRSSTASDFAWYRSSKVSDIWK